MKTGFDRFFDKQMENPIFAAGYAKERARIDKYDRRLMKDFSGKRVLITGAASGIGLALAKEFAIGGAELILVDLNEELLTRAAEQLRQQGTIVHNSTCNISYAHDVNSLSQWVNSLGGIDILINNAGIGYHGELADIRRDHFENLMFVNFWGTWNTIHMFLPSMLSQGSGQIVNVSSGQVFFQLPTWAPYTISKMALAGYSEMLHYELRNKNIFVTTVYPFMVNTSFYDDIKGKTWGAKLSMKLLPYYSMKPETVAKKIYQATLKKKRVEMVSILNSMGKLIDIIPGMRGIVSTVGNFILAK